MDESCCILAWSARLVTGLKRLQELAAHFQSWPHFLLLPWCCTLLGSLAALAPILAQTLAEWLTWASWSSRAAVRVSIAGLSSRTLLSPSGWSYCIMRCAHSTSVRTSSVEAVTTQTMPQELLTCTYARTRSEQTSLRARNACTPGRCQCALPCRQMRSQSRNKTHLMHGADCGLNKRDWRPSILAQALRLGNADSEGGVVRGQLRLCACRQGTGVRRDATCCRRLFSFMATRAQYSCSAPNQLACCCSRRPQLQHRCSPRPGWAGAENCDTAQWRAVAACADTVAR